MAASKRLIQLGSRLRAFHLGSTMNTHMPPLRRTSLNSYRLLSSSSSGYGSESSKTRKQNQVSESSTTAKQNQVSESSPTTEQNQGLELDSLRRDEYTKLQYEIASMREKLENMDTVSHLKTEHQVRNMCDEIKKLFLEAKKSVIKYSISATRLVRGAFEELLAVSPHEAPPVTGVKGLLILGSIVSGAVSVLLNWAFLFIFGLILSLIFGCAYCSLSLIYMIKGNDSKDQNGCKGQKGYNDGDSRKD